MVLFVQPVGRYEAVEKFHGKVDADAMAWRRHLNFEGGSKIDTHGHYVDNRMSTYICVPQKMHFSPKTQKGDGGMDEVLRQRSGSLHTAHCGR
jgi:hypothetical protein